MKDLLTPNQIATRHLEVLGAFEADDPSQAKAIAARRMIDAGYSHIAAHVYIASAYRTGMSQRRHAECQGQTAA